MTPRANVPEQFMVLRPLFADSPYGQEEVGEEMQPLSVSEMPFNEETQVWLENATEEFNGIAWELNQLKGQSRWYRALAGIDQQPILQSSDGNKVADVANPRALLLALPPAGTTDRSHVRVFLAHTAGGQVHKELTRATPELASQGMDESQDASMLSGVLSTVSREGRDPITVAALYDNLGLCPPDDEATMIATLKAHRVLPVSCDGFPQAL